MGAHDTPPRRRGLTLACVAGLAALTLAACERGGDRSANPVRDVGEAIKKVGKSSSDSFKRASERTRRAIRPGSN